ncbi:MAG: peptide deformylase [Bacillota bacterium]|nr:peptide deformylase [Bacillota bacterium]
MAIRKIVLKGDEVLSKVCRPVEKFDKRLADLIDDMADTLKESNGVGLAAPQVGVLKRIVVIDTGEKMLELVNPEIIETEGEQHNLEGCLSMPELYCITSRPQKVKIRAFDRNENLYEYEGEDLIARAFCHETDHLNGILITDVYTPLTEEELDAYLKREE